MKPRRFRSILDARGIEGLLCFGSPTINAELPPELDHYAIVTQGMSIRTPLHRVITHAFNDTWRALELLRQFGYRRPGLVLGRYEPRQQLHNRDVAAEAPVDGGELDADGAAAEYDERLRHRLQVNRFVTRDDPLPVRGDARHAAR